MMHAVKYPVVYIQCDWNDVLRLPNSEAWISSKYLNEPSTHGKIVSVSTSTENKNKFSVSEGFSILNQTLNIMVIKHIQSDLITAFVAPMKSLKIHNKAVYSVSAAENAMVISSSEDDKIIVWDSRTGEELLNLQGHGGPAYKCRFFPSGTVVLTAGADGSLKIWSAESGANPVTLVGHTMAITDMAIIDKGRNVLSVSKDGKVKLWDVGESTCLADILSGHGVINCCCITTTSNIQEVQNPREVATGDKLMIAGCENGSVLCAHIALREIIFTIPMDSPVNCCAALDQNIIIGCQNGKICHISAENGSILHEWWESASPVICLQSLSSSKFVAGTQDGTCIVHSIDHPSIRVELTGSDCDSIRDVSFNGRWLLSACRDCTVRKYDYNQISVHFK